MSSRHAPRIWPARKPASRNVTLPESDRDARIWRTELPNGMILEEIGTPGHRLPGEPQAVLAKGAPEAAPVATPAALPKEAPADAPTAAAAERLRNHRAITRNA